MKAYIYMVLLGCDFSPMPPGSTAFSSSKAAPRITRGFSPTSKPRTGRGGAGIRSEGIPVSPSRAAGRARGKAPVSGDLRKMIYHLMATKSRRQEKRSQHSLRKHPMDHSLSDHINEEGKKKRERESNRRLNAAQTSEVST